jgi:hypothetical protein
MVIVENREKLRLVEIVCRRELGDKKSNCDVLEISSLVLCYGV